MKPSPKEEGDGGGGDRPLVKAVVLLGAAGLLLMFLSPDGSDRERADEDDALQVAAVRSAAGSLDRGYAEALEAALARRLSAIRGVGDVTVMVTTATGPRREYAGSRSEEVRWTTDGGGDGSERAVAEERMSVDPVMTRDGGESGALVEVEHRPELQGALVVAAGAEDPFLAEQLMHAASAALGLPPHQISVQPKQ